MYWNNFYLFHFIDTFGVGESVLRNMSSTSLVVRW